MNINTSNQAQSALMPVIYIPHGGGPMPLLGDADHKELIAYLSQIHNNIETPKVILMITAHWESHNVSISSSPQPGMIYDYGGFPQETYQYQYPASGEPKVANQIADLFKAKGIKSNLDMNRGYDHGTFVPLMLMYPNAEIPVVQMSLLRSLNPKEHIKIGEALSTLREQGVLIVGSGMSFHNFRGSLEESIEFDNWLNETLTANDMEQSKQDLIQWEQAPSARACHAREEHLLPMHVCFGAAMKQNTPATRVFSDYLFNRKISAFMW